MKTLSEVGRLDFFSTQLSLTVCVYEALSGCSLCFELEQERFWS